MPFELVRMSEQHRTPVIDIFNYFIESGFAAYPEDKVPYGFFDAMLKMVEGYPALVVVDTAASNRVVGFAFMRGYHSMKAFNRAAELSYFLLPDCTRKGVGTRIVELFADEARKRGIDVLMAEISSLNEASIRFHEKAGFSHCGRFRRIGRKFGRDFDVVWMQRLL